MEKKIVSFEEELKEKKYFQYQEYSPDLWAAKYGHLILCGDFRNNIYPDKEFQKWVHELFRILHTEDVEQIKIKLLTKDEIEKIEKEIKKF